jgi:hypothetical protein
MPVGKASWRDFSTGMWVKGPRENTPSGALRRAVGTHVQKGQGSILSRSGTVLDVAEFVGHTHTMGQLGTVRVVGFSQTFATESGGVLTTAPAVWQSGGGNPSGSLTDQRWNLMELPIQFLSTSPNVAADLSTPTGNNQSYMFVSNAGTAFKFDGTNGSYWGIDAPHHLWVENLTVTPQAASTKVIRSLDNLTNATGAGASGFAVVVDTNRFVEGTGSIRLDCMRDSETIATYSFAPAGYTPLDLTAFSVPGDSTDEDYIQFWVHIARPVNIQSINIKFFVQSSGTFDNTKYNQDPNVIGGASPNTAPYSNYYYTELSVQVVKEKRKRQLLGLGDFVPFDPENKQMKRYLAHHPPDKGPDLDALQFLNPKTIAVSRNTWTKVTIPKGLFDRAGNAGAANLTWANVVGMQLSVETNKSGNTSVWFDDVRLNGGVGTRGDYLYTVTFRNDNTGARSNPPYKRATDGTITIVTTPSVTLDRQGTSITGFPAVLAASNFRGGALEGGFPGVVDNQVTHIEIWRTIGNGNPGKSNALFNAPTSLQMFLVDKIAIGTTSYTDLTADYPGMHSLSGAKFLNSDQEMEFDNMPVWSVNEAIGTPRSSTITQSVYHAPTGRVFFTDSSHASRVFITPPGRPESVQDFIEPTSLSVPVVRLVVWNDNLYIFTARGVLQLEGADRPFFATPLAGVPGTPYPYTVIATPQGIFYVSQDGARLFDGQTSTLVADAALDPLFKGAATTEGLPAIKNRTIDGLTYTMLASYGRNEVLLADQGNNVYGYNIADDSWRVIPIATVMVLAHDKDDGTNNGVIRAGISTNIGKSTTYWFDGTAAGEQSGVVGEATTDGAGLFSGGLDVQTPSVFVAGENQGIIMLLFIEADTQGQSVTVAIETESTTIACGTISSSTKTRFEFNINRIANLAAVHFTTSSPLTSRIEISSIELQMYESAGE